MAAGEYDDSGTYDGSSSGGRRRGARNEESDDDSDDAEDDEDDEDGEPRGAGSAAGPFMDAVVKVYCVHTEPNYSLPWQRKRQYASTSSGFVIRGPQGERWLLTNAHSVEYNSQVKVKRRGDDTKFLAKVLAVGTECDVALLTVDDDSFWEGLRPLAFGGLPRLQDAVVSFFFSFFSSLSLFLVSPFFLIFSTHARQNFKKNKTKIQGRRGVPDRRRHDFGHAGCGFFYFFALGERREREVIFFLTSSYSIQHYKKIHRRRQPHRGPFLRARLDRAFGHPDRRRDQLREQRRVSWSF